MSQNSMGDPEMTIFTVNPMEFTKATVPKSGTTVLVSTGGVTDCTIALTSMDLGESYFSVEKGVSSAIFLDVSVPYRHHLFLHIYKVCIIKCNIILRLRYCDNTAYNKHKDE